MKSPRELAEEVTQLFEKAVIDRDLERLRSLFNFHHPDGDYPGCARALLEAGSEVEDWMLKATPEVVEVLRRRLRFE